ncbi:carboxyltransferase domain-containing protein [Phaeobacter sp. NW0010-22]|uniref:5-oxoprolinase subunit B family protein n=1 Tax=Phaeobacter sp. NW0010-22 TaxID=3135907 RepID=UPI00310338DD
MPHAPQPSDSYPLVRNVGLDGMLVSFADTMTEPSNRAALAFRGALEGAGWDGVIETSTSLASAYIRFDPLQIPHAEIASRLNALLATRDWSAEALPTGRKLWRVPTVYGTDLAPQLEDAAAAAGLSASDAITRLAASRVRVLTIGFAPGQPYLGPLGPEFNIPRLQELNPMVPEGALVLAISQFVLFSGPTPTGWRHVGQTAFRCFRPELEQSFALNPGDEMMFHPITKPELEQIRANNADGTGGATCEEITT